MKRFMALLTLISVIAILTACSSESSLELTNKKVEIIDDKERLGSMILQQGEKSRYRSWIYGIVLHFFNKKRRK